jgi:site-specific DNA-methyltransferase (adenine-specific)
MLPINKIICGAAEDVLKTFPDESINCCISSPPYWALRDYGIDGQLGLEPTFEEYIDKLCNIYDEVKRVLRPDGTCWVNLGDTYAAHKDCKSVGQTIARGTSREKTHCIDKGKSASRNSKMLKKMGMPDKSLCLIPQRFAIEMVNRGWILRNTIIWHKPNPMPSSAKDRFTVDFEYVYFFTKSNTTLYWVRPDGKMVSKQPDYKAGIEGLDWKWGVRKGKRVKLSLWQGRDYWFEPQYEAHTDPKGSLERSKYVGHTDNGKRLSRKDQYRPDAYTFNPLGRNKRTVWTIPTQPFPQAHFACVDEKTQILTAKGWKYHHEINYKTRIKVATYNIAGGFVEYQPIQYLKQYSYDGNMIKVGNRDLDILMTPNHRNVVQFQNNQIGIRLAENLKYRDKIIVFADVVYDSDYSITTSWAFLAGWVISEGHYKKGGFIEIYQNEGDNADRIRDVLQDAEIPYTENTRMRQGKKQVTWYLKKCAFVDWMYKNVPDKELNKRLVFLPLSRLQCLFDALISGDGHKRKDDGRICFIQKSKKCVEWFEILALHIGFHTTTTPRKEGGYTVFCNHKTKIGIRKTSGKGIAVERIPYKGVVWCPKTPNGTWVAKRNGRVFITGNTYPEKLVEPMIKAGCPEFVCTKCGKAREKIWEKPKPPKSVFTNTAKPTDGYVGGYNKDGEWKGCGQKLQNWINEHPPAFKGYTDCGCKDREWRPGIVLDCFRRCWHYVESGRLLAA